MAWPVSTGVQATKRVFPTPVTSDPGVPVSPKTATKEPGIQTSTEPGAYGPRGSLEHQSQVPLKKVKFVPEVPVSTKTATFCPEGTLNEEPGAYGPVLPADNAVRISTEGLQTVHQFSRHNNKRFVPTLDYS